MSVDEAARGPLDDALDRLARRDEWRRRAEGKGPDPITPPALGDLAEAVARVVSRHPDLLVTLGVQGAGPPVLMRVAHQDGIVQVDLAPPGLAAASAPPQPAPSPASPPPAAPSPPPAEPAPDADAVAVRLAALLREDPSLLQVPPR